jgi:hypothetical protein
MNASQHPAKQLRGLWIIIAFAVVAVVAALVLKPWSCDSVADCLTRDKATADTTVRVP